MLYFSDDDFADVELSELSDDPELPPQAANDNTMAALIPAANTFFNFIIFFLPDTTN